MRATVFVLTFASLSILLTSSYAFADDADLNAIFDGITEIQAGGAIPGPVCVFGESAFPVLPAKFGGVLAATAGAARYGQGRVFIMAHEGLISGGQPGSDNLRFLINAVNWAGAGRTRTVAVHALGVAGVLRDAGAEVRELTDADFAAGLEGCDVLVVGGFAFDGPANAAKREAVRSFVENGGGLVTGACPWGWKYSRPNLDIATDLGVNEVLAPMGLVFADGYVDGPYKPMDAEALRYTHAGLALEALAAHTAGRAELTPEDLKQVGVTLSTAIRAIPPGDQLLLPRLYALCAEQTGGEYPTPDTPVSTENPFARLSATIEMREMDSWTTAAEVKAHPSAAAFPGAIPEGAERVNRTLAVDAAMPDWHGTGLYAGAGEPITVTLPADAADKGLRVRIGCHTDGIWHHDSWQRFPEISRSYPLTDAVTTVASPFGGLVYIEVPRGSTLGTLEVGIQGAAEAPRFVLGETTLAEWRDTVRLYPGPWAELEGRNVILTVPSHEIRELDDPESLMIFWDYALDLDADLSARSRERDRQERIVADVQISAGYMHSGYPIMTWLDAPARAVSLPMLLSEGSWGHFHELGHNHQSGDWTFDGTGEVTVNLFTVYVHEMACHMPGRGHPELTPEKMAAKMAAHMEAGAPFEKWKSDPFLALCTYIQLRDAFGWQAFRNVIASYRTDPEDALPKNDDEKRDQWMVRFSREVGRDLGPFFQAWGVPSSDAARASIAGLPGWMPDEVAL